MAIEARTALAETVKALMYRRQWSQVRLSKQAHVAQTTISNVLNPDAPSPKLSTLQAIADAFEVEVWHLVCPGMPVAEVEPSHLATAPSTAGHLLLARFEILGKAARSHIIRYAALIGDEDSDYDDEAAAIRMMQKRA